MPNWLIALVCMIGISYGMLHALLMLISPSTHRRFNLRVTDPFRKVKLRTPERDTNPGLELQYRLAGLVGVLGCIFIAWGILDSLLGHHRGQPLHGQAPAPRIALGRTSWGFIGSGGFFLFGLYAYFWPFRVYEWGIKRAFPPSVATPEPNQIRKGGRLLGICFMILGVISFLFALK